MVSIYLGWFVLAFAYLAFAYLTLAYRVWVYAWDLGFGLWFKFGSALSLATVFSLYDLKV